MNPPISGQNMREPYSPRLSSGAAAAGAAPPQACKPPCSLADGKAHATWSRRSCRKTKRIWLGGRRPSGRAGRKVAQGPVSVTAQSRFLWKKQSSQLGLLDVRPGAIGFSASSSGLLATTGEAFIKAQQPGGRNAHVRKSQKIPTRTEVGKLQVFTGRAREAFAFSIAFTASG